MSAASRRDDRCLVAPQHLKGGAAKKIGEKLIAAGLVREVKAKGDAPVWRRDAEGQAFALKLTAAGLKAIAIDEPAGVEEDPAPGREAVRSNDRVKGPPRDGSKLANIIALLERRDGASLDELVAATGWLPHTTRAALTGLRKRSVMVLREKGEAGEKSRYRIASGELPIAAAA